MCEVRRGEGDKDVRREKGERDRIPWVTRILGKYVGYK
jgi:hypothetical protein